MDTVIDHRRCVCGGAPAAGKGRRDAVHGGAGEAGAGVAGGAAGKVGGRDRHRDPAGEAVRPRRAAEEYHQRYLEKSGQSAAKGGTDPMRCYG